jgi:hypothetical protein
MKPLFIRRGLQYLIGGTIAISAFAKALDVSGFAEVLRTYHAFPDSTLFPLALTITTLELCLGVWILWGHRLHISATAAAIMNTAYAGWMVFTLLRGLHIPNCGCFGVFFARPLTWSTPLEDLVFAGLCLFLRYLAGSPRKERFHWEGKEGKTKIVKKG